LVADVVDGFGVVVVVYDVAVIDVGECSCAGVGGVVIAGDSYVYEVLLVVVAV